MAALRRALDRTVAERRCLLVTVLGAAGVGKSRLAAAFADEVAGVATIWTGRCLSYGEGITYWPLREVFDRAGDADALVRAMAMTTRAETFRAIRSFLEDRARARPLVLMLEDIHWAEDTLLELLTDLGEHTADAPLLVVCLARPELLDAHPGWLEGSGTRVTLELTGLGAAESERLLADRTGWRALDEATRRRIVDRAEGNPLFLEEMLAVVVEAGDMPDRGGHEMPTTIQAVLVARLERLDHDEGRVAGVASVEGKEFHADAVGTIAPATLQPEVPHLLETLVRKRLVQPAGPGVAGDTDFAFRHQLIRDAAYGRLAKADRAHLHERFGTWLHGALGAGPGVDEIAGYHLEQAWRYRTEVDPDDPAAPDVAARAAQRLAHAGAAALARSDVKAAVGLLRRAAVLLLPGDHLRAEVLPDLGAALTASGSLAEADEVLGRAVEEAVARKDDVAEARAAVEQVTLRLMIDPQVGGEEALREGERIVAILDGSSEDRTLAKAWFVIGQAHLYASRYTEMERASRASLEHARRAADAQQSAIAVQWLATAIVGGPTPVAEAIAALQDLRPAAASDSEAEAGLLINLGRLESLAGRIEAARELVDRGRAVFRDLGMEVMWAVNGIERSMVEFAAGDPALAVEVLRESCDALERMGERDFFSTAAGCLAMALVSTERLDEAERWSHRSEEAAAADDLPSQVAWRSARSRALARRGETSEAEGLAREALALTESSDDPTFVGDALVDLAEVIGLGGAERGEVRICLERAIKCYEAKGASGPAAKARARLTALGP